MSKTVVSLFSKLFGIREGEIQRVLLMQLNIFLIITTLLIIKPTVNGLFLAEVGVKQLPVVFIMVAILAVLLSKVYNRLLGQISFQHILLGTLGISVLLLLFFGWVLQSSFRGEWVYYAFYVWSTVFGVLAASQFWIFASMLFNIREAKRLFGFISVGAISGGIFGGYLTIFLTDIIGSEQQVFVAAALLSLCLPITYFIWQRNISGIHSSFQRRKQLNKAERPLNLIRQSPHLSYLAGIIGVSVIAAKLVDYQFSAIAADRISDPDELTAFFGFWFSSFNLLSLAIQLLLTRRVVGTLGIGTSLLFQPAAILLGAVLLFFIPGLGFAIFIKMGDSSLKQSINKAAFELLSLPIPARIKNQTKTYIDVVIDSVATGIGGLILIFVINGLQMSTTYVSLIIIVLVMIWIWLIWKVRKSYLRSFRNQLLNPSSEETAELDLSHQSILENLQTVLEKGAETEILATLQKLIQTPDPRLAPAIFKALQHPSVAVKEASLQALYFVPQASFLETVEQLIYHPQQNIKIAAFDYLIVQNTMNSTELFSRFLQKDQPKIQLAALVSMARESRNNLFLKKQLQLEQIVEDRIQTIDVKNPDIDTQFLIIGLLKAIGWGRLESHYSLIEQQFKAPVLNLRRQAILAAGQTLDPIFIPKLIGFLEQEEEKTAAQQALRNYGPAIINDLKNIVEHQSVNAALLLAIPAIAESVGTQASVDLLFNLVQQNNWEIRLTALYALQQSKIRFPHLRFKAKSVSNLILKEAQLYQDTLSILYVQQKNEPGPEMIDFASTQLQQQRRTLIGLLEKRLDANLKRIFHLLGLKYPPDDIESIYQHLRSKEEDMRTNALEYLDNLLEPSLKTIIIPIVETAMLDSISEKVIRSLKWRIPAEQECYRLLLNRDDPPLRQAVEKLQQLKAAVK
jgi:AAA family ATP:ADP antiporter